jgi:CheY-like chemotaxis protein
LEQVFVNLFINAEHALADAREGGTGTLRVRTTWKSGLKHVGVDVEDTGSGIAPEHIESIFDPFFTTKEGKGTGLGLSTSYSIVKSHQGEVRVTSTLGQGTLFRVTLPLAPATPAAAARLPHKGAGPRRSGGDILVVDDEVRIQELLREALEMHGYKVAACGTGEAALEMLKKRTFNLMLLDIRMPARSGLWLLSEIRRAALKMPVIVITGLATPEERDQALELGAIRCFQKPFKVDELLEAVDATLRK